MKATPSGLDRAGLRRIRFRDLSALAAAGATPWAVAAVAGHASPWLALGAAACVGAAALWRLGVRVPDFGDAAAAIAPGTISEAELGRGALAVFRRAPFPLLVLDGRGRVVAANEEAARAFAVRVGYHVSASLRMPEVLAAVERVRARRRPETLDVARPGEVEQRYSVHVDRLNDLPPARDEAPALFMLLIDVTTVRRAERLRADFVAHASHELRTPLAALSGFIETLQGPARDDPEAQARFLDVMAAQAARMRRLIADLLSLSRIEMNEHSPPADIVDLAMIAQDAAEALAPVAADRGARIETAFDGPAMVVGDADQLMQVMLNLIDNAVKYGGDHGVVTISRSAARRSVVAIAVADRGPGVPEQDIPRLTERFYRVDAAESRARGGTGLGLAIVKHILSRHRGALRIASRRGVGSTFTVELPQAPDDDHPQEDKKISAVDETPQTTARTAADAGVEARAKLRRQ